MRKCKNIIEIVLEFVSVQGSDLVNLSLSVKPLFPADFAEERRIFISENLRYLRENIILGSYDGQMLIRIPAGPLV